MNLFTIDCCIIIVSIIRYCESVSGPHSTVGNLSDCRYVSHCRSRGREFNPSPVPYFPREHSVIVSTCIKLPFVFKIFILYIFVGPLKTGITVMIISVLFLEHHRSRSHFCFVRSRAKVSLF